MHTIITIAILIWIFLLIIIYVGWNNLKEYKCIYNNIKEKINVSVLIPFRNEEKNLERLINTLSTQTYPAENIEVIFINDHSTDNSVDLLKKMTKNKDNFKILHLNDKLHGKKQAILKGISYSKNNLIILTDADAYLQAQWIETIVSYFQSNNFPDIIIGPVDYIEKNSLFSKITRIEFLSLIISGMSFAQLKKPIFANSINLTFKKELFENNKKDDILKKNIPSGDDTFLIHYAKKKKKRILPLKSKNAIVYTNNPDTIKEFFLQRSRWASKVPYYNDIQSLIIAFIVLSVHIITCLSMIFFIFSKQYLITIPLFLKIFAEIIFFNKTLIFFNKNFHINEILITQIFYPFYIIITVFLNVFHKNEWKNRKI